jgi:hypothetical protein
MTIKRDIARNWSDNWFGGGCSTCSLEQFGGEVSVGALLQHIRGLFRTLRYNLGSRHQRIDERFISFLFS